MGFKLKRFRAKLTGKTREKKQEVVCLHYKIHSEFDEIPATTFSTCEPSSPQTKVPLKPSADNQFRNSNYNNVTEYVQREEKIGLENHHGYSKSSNAAESEHLQEAKYGEKQDASAPLKSILKKPAHDEENPAEEEEDIKSTLISMTAKSDEFERYLPEIQITSYDADIENEASRNSHESIATEIPEEPSKANEEVELRSKVEEEEPEEEEETKTVRWRETVIEIRPPSKQFDEENAADADRESTARQKMINEMNQRFKKQNEDLHPVHTGNREGLAAAENSEPEDEAVHEPQYRYSTAYSNQAASIFFAGEEAEPAARVRKVRDDANESATAI